MIKLKKIHVQDLAKLWYDDTYLPMLKKTFKSDYAYIKVTKDGLISKDQLTYTYQELTSGKHEVIGYYIPKENIYISGPISGQEQNAKKSFLKAYHMLNREGYYAINPFDIGNQLNCKKWNEYMREDLKEMISRSNQIYMLDGWVHSKGARLEHDIAISLGFNIIYQDLNHEKYEYNN